MDTSEDDADDYQPASKVIARRRKPQKLLERSEKLLKFFYEKSIDITEPLQLNHVFTEWKVGIFEKTPHLPALYGLFRHTIVPTIPDHPSYDDEAKAQMLFACSSSLDQGFLDKLRENAVVEVDEYNRITKYESTRGGLRLQGKHKRIPFTFQKNSTGSRASPRITVANSRQWMTSPARLRTRRGRPIKIPNLDYGTDESIPADYNNGQKEDNVAMNGDEDDVDIQITAIVPAKPGNRGMKFCSVIKQEPQEYEPTIHQPFPDSCESTTYPTNVFSSSNFNNNNYIGPQENGGILNGVSNFMMSMTGFFQSQTNMIREMTRISTDSPSTSSTSASNPINAENETIGLRDFLKHIQRYLVHLDTMSLASVNHQIIVELQNIGIVDKMIQMSKMKSALESTLALVGPHCTGVSHMESTNSKEFLKHIYMYSCTFEQLHDIRDQFKQKIDSIHDLHMIPLVKLRSALEAAIGIVVY